MRSYSRWKIAKLDEDIRGPISSGVSLGVA